MIRKAAAVAFGGAALVVAVPTAAVADVPVSRVGWWTRSPTPPTVPDGGVAVGAAPDGDLTVGAVLLDAGGGASGVGLRLVETGGQGQSLAAIVVCPTTSTWAAAEGGAMDDAPPAETCEGSSVAMTRADDGTWTADVAFANGKAGDVGLLVKPAPGSVAFQLSFAPPMVTGTVTAANAGDSGEPSAAPSPSPSPSPSASPSPSPSTTRPAPSPVAATTPTTIGLVVPPSVESSDGASTDAASGQIATPVFGGVPPSAGAGDADVSRFTVVLWYVLALAVGTVIAGITWARNEGRLSTATLLAVVRRRA